MISLSRNLVQVLLILFCINLALPSFAQKTNSKNQLLWKIEGKSLKKPSYLFGTMHIKDERVFNLSDSVFIGMSSTEVFASEIDMDNAFAEMMKLLFKRDTTQKIKKLLSATDYEKLDTKVREKLGVGLENINSKETWMLDLFVRDYDHDKSENQRETFLDAYLYDLAKKLKKKTIGLEKLQDYSDISRQENTEKKLKNLVYQVEQQSSEVDFQNIISIYENGDLKEIDDFRKSFPKSFNHSLLLRNVNMANRMDSILQNQSMFVAMGCAHLPGDSGMIDLLRKMGYTLSPVTAIYSGIEKKFKFEAFGYNWKSYSPSDLMFTVDAPSNMFAIPIEAYSEFDMQMHMSIDIYRSAYFLVMTLNTGTEISYDQEELMLKKFADRMTKRPGWELISKTYNEDGGKKKMTIIVKSKNQYYKYLLSVKGNIVLAGAVAGSKKIVNDIHSSRFLNSIEFQKSYKTVVNSSTMLYTDSAGAFQVIMPKKLKDYSQGMASEEVDVKMKYNLLPYEGNVFFASHYLYKGGLMLEDDSATLEITAANILGERSDSFEKKEHFIFQNKYKALELVFVQEQINYTKLFIIARGNRLYMFMVVGTKESVLKESVADFFNSINFIGFSYSMSPKTFYMADSTVSFNYFTDIEPIIDTSIVYEYKGVFYNGFSSCSFNDSETSGAYAVSNYSISPYYTVVDPRKFIDSISISNMDTTTNKIESVFYESKNGLLIKNFKVKNAHDKYKRYRYVLGANNLFEIVAVSTDEDMFSKRADFFFNTIDYPENKKSIYSDKGKSLLVNLMLEDTILFEEAKTGIDIVQFSVSDLDQLERAMLFDYKDKDDRYLKISNELLKAMQRSFPNEFAKIAEGIYLKYKDSSNLKKSPI